MAHSNYTVTTHTSIETANDSVSSGSIVNSVTLVITPNTGFVATASNFSIGDPLPPEIASVTFSDSGTAGQPGNTVNVLVTLNGAFTMPASDVILLIDIDGDVQERGNPRENVTVCVTENVADSGYTTTTSGGVTTTFSGKGGVGPTTLWPATIVSTGPVTPANNFPATKLSEGHFVETTQGTGITATVTADVAYTNPINSLPNIPAGVHADQCTQTRHEGTVAPNTTVTLFTKTFWTGPEFSFSITPFYTMNAAASNSGYYTIEETPDNITLVKTLTQSTTSSNIVYCDTTGILPGMQLLTNVNSVTHSTISCAGPPGGYDSTTAAVDPAVFCFPWFFADIRVASVDAANNRLYLTESNTWANGDTLTFSSISQITDGTYSSLPNQVLCKKFTVKYNAPSTNPCSNNHVINMQGHAGMWGTHLITEEGQTSPSRPQITQVDIDTSDISASGEGRVLTVETSSDLTKFNVAVLDEEGKSYDFDNAIFTTVGNNILTAQQSENNTRLWRRPIMFPAVGTSNKVYSINVTPYTSYSNSHVDLTPTFATNVSGSITGLTSYSLKDIKITSDAGSSGVTIDSSLTDITILETEGRTNISQEISLSGNITKGGNVIYTNSEVISGFSGADSNDMTSNVSTTLSGSGTTSIRSSVTGTITKAPTADTTVTIDYGNHISQTPNAYNASFTVSKSRAISAGKFALRVHRTLVDLDAPFTQKTSDVSGGIEGTDYDATFVAGSALPSPHKDFIVVSSAGCTLGTLGSNGTSFDDDFFYGNSGGTQGSSTEVDQIVYKISSTDNFEARVEPGRTTETFTFKCNDGTTDSATVTATINFRE